MVRSEKENVELCSSSLFVMHDFTLFFAYENDASIVLWCAYINETNYISQTIPLLRNCLKYPL